ncbi:MAG: type II secretion system F family protein [Phycisphaerales bacterium]|nr:type II secretion system F family protein [Phycisphaerales bacterium]
MTTFAFTAVATRGGTGAPITGQREAANENAVREQLREQGLVPLSVRPVHAFDALRGQLAAGRSVLRASDRLWFFQTLGMLLGSAVPIESALQTMEELGPSTLVKRACKVLRDRLRGGETLAKGLEALASGEADGARMELASAQQVALIRSGEHAGRLAHVVQLIDTSMRNAARIKRTLASRLIYPALLLIAAIGAVWMLGVFVIPRFAATLESLGGELPLPTRITLAASHVLVWLVPGSAVVALLAVGLRKQWMTPGLRKRIARLALRLPIAGTLLWHARSAAITDIIATTIEGGGDALSGLEHATHVVQSPVLAERVAAARSAVREGADLGQALREHEVLPPMLGAVVAAGMKSGDLAPALRRATEMALETQEALGSRLLAVMEPMIILCMAGAVGWVVYSLVSGMLAMSTIAGG